ncbi:MAG: fimbria/pilus periplasmic chaperone [Pseudomonas sp.]
MSFAIVQPLVRLERHEHLLLRVLCAGQGLPDDREVVLAEHYGYPAQAHRG